MRRAPLLLLLLPFAVVSAGKDRPQFNEDIQEIIDHVHSECVAETGVTEETIKACDGGDFREDPKLKCYMFCLLEVGNIADENGVVDYDMMISLIPEEVAERASKMIFACKHLDTMDKDKCQRAFDVHKCSYEKDPDFYFLL